jgi:CheY-like chemotaxis protein
MTGHQQGARVNEILFWMIGVENAAANLYSEAAVCFSDDKKLSGFLHHLAVEEREHLKLLRKTMESLPIARLAPAAIYFDDDFRRKIDQPIISAQNALDRGELKSNDIIDIIAEIEFSEWNEAFIYTISASKGLGEDFEKAAAKIDQHRIGIQNFISDIPQGESLLQRVRRLRQQTKNRVLIVENDLATAIMLKALLMDEAEVTVARDGDEGLAQIRKGHFDLILSEVNTPKIRGIEMYKKALTLAPELEYRFIFFSDTKRSEDLNFLMTSKIAFLPKPSSVQQICNAISRILNSPPPRENKRLH